MHRPPQRTFEHWQRSPSVARRRPAVCACRWRLDEVWNGAMENAYYTCAKRTCRRAAGDQSAVACAGLVWLLATPWRCVDGKTGLALRRRVGPWTWMCTHAGFMASCPSPLPVERHALPPLPACGDSVPVAHLYVYHCSIGYPSHPAYRAWPRSDVERRPPTNVHPVAHIAPPRPKRHAGPVRRLTASHGR